MPCLPNARLDFLKRYNGLLGKIVVTNVSKAFTIRHNRSNSLKSKFVGMFHKRYREQEEILWALKNVSLNIAPSQTFGLVGRNGSGKSTLLRVIAGIYQPTSGKVTLPAGARVGSMIDLGVGFNVELTGRENIFLSASMYGLQGKEIEAIYPAVVEFAELEAFMDVPIKNYSSGMQARLGFGLAVNLNPDVLLVDEIFAVGDEAFKDKCAERMTQFRTAGKTIVMVSHDPGTIMNFCDRVCLLDHGIVLFTGDADEAFERYHAMLRH